MKEEINWEGYVRSKKKGTIVFVAPNWRDDKFRSKVFRLARKGYFKIVTKRERKRGGGYGDYLERTDKAWIVGDSPRKPIEFSFPHSQIELPTAQECDASKAK